MRNPIRDTIALELGTLIREADFVRCADFMQHGDTSVLLHCLAVAYYSARVLAFLRIPHDRRALVRGALLHDFFLYDWHTRHRAKGEQMHAFSHPGAALRNAQACVELTPKEENIILRHMFPVTLVPPRTWEGLAVCLTDKVCAFYEGLRKQAYPALRKDFEKLLPRL